MARVCGAGSVSKWSISPGCCASPSPTGVTATLPCGHTRSQAVMLVWCTRCGTRGVVHAVWYTRCGTHGVVHAVWYTRCGTRGVVHAVLHDKRHDMPCDVSHDAPHGKSRDAPHGKSHGGSHGTAPYCSELCTVQACGSLHLARNCVQHARKGIRIAQTRYRLPDTDDGLAA
eukprot:365759-Chlamydomonas_euryale.AAC.2